jgi:hypothetical protein
MNRTISLSALVRTGVAVAVALLTALLLVSLEAESSVRQAAAAEARRSQSLRLAYELRQTSDDLTRMARTYVVTARAQYRDWFQEILEIRDGTAPRPENYDKIYWDVVTDTGRRPSPFGPPIAFATLAASAGFTSSELNLLATAKARSDALADIEESAFALVAKGGSANQQRATQMLFDSGYLRAKDQIMQPIGQVLALVDTRTAARPPGPATRPGPGRPGRSRRRCCCSPASRCSWWSPAGRCCARSPNWMPPRPGSRPGMPGSGPGSPGWASCVPWPCVTTR